jgi:Na+:H+ antiporter, NhaA family
MFDNELHELVAPVDPLRDHIAGPFDAPMQLLEYGDFECPYCALAHPNVTAVQRELGNRLAFVFRHFPLTSAHPNAELAAEASEAAAAQGKFWPMHDRLFETRAVAPRDLVIHARALDLDIDTFVEDLEARRYTERIREDLASGARSGVNGTPTFFVNGRRHDGSYEAETLLAALTAAPARK